MGGSTSKGIDAFITGKGIDAFITGDTDVAGYPAERDGFVSNRESEEPVLDFANKRMGRVDRGNETKRVPGVSKDGKGGGRVGEVLQGI